MTITGIIGLLAAIAKAIPALASLCNQIIGVVEKLDKSRNEKAALERLEEKNRAVDARIDGIGLLPPEAQQQRSANESTGLPSSGDSGSGMVPGRAEDNQSS